jgi:antitoxin component of MazEF toxin-antitoxin module
MSDFASAIIVLNTPRTTVVKAVMELDLPTWIAPACGPDADRVALFPNGEPKRIVRALAVHLPKAVLVTIDVGDEIPVTVGVHKGGSMVATVHLDEGASAKQVQTAVGKLASAMAVPMPLFKQKALEPTRYAVYRLLDVQSVLPHHHFASVTRLVAEDPSDFVGFTFVHDTKVREVTIAADEDDMVATPVKRKPSATGKHAVIKPSAPAKRVSAAQISLTEAVELSATFQHARTEPGRAEVIPGAEKQLAKASSATEWLAIRRTIDPARVTPDVVSELVSVIRHGRFPNEGERATVVREGAAMLLGRSLKAQGATAASVIKMRGDVVMPNEQACWDIVMRMAGLASE